MTAKLNAKFFVLRDADAVTASDDADESVISALFTHIGNDKNLAAQIEFLRGGSDDGLYTDLLSGSSSTSDECANVDVAFVYLTPDVAARAHWKYTTEFSSKLPSVATYMFSYTAQDTARTSKTTPLDFWRYVQFDYAPSTPTRDVGVSNFRLSGHALPGEVVLRSTGIAELVCATLKGVIAGWKYSSDLKVNMDVMQTYASQVSITDNNMISRMNRPFSTYKHTPAVQVAILDGDKSGVGRSRSMTNAVYMDKKEDISTQLASAQRLGISLLVISVVRLANANSCNSARKRMNAENADAKKKFYQIFFVVVINNDFIKSGGDRANLDALVTFVTESRAELQMMFTIVSDSEFNVGAFWTNTWITAVNRSNMRSYVEKYGTKTKDDFISSLTNAEKVMKEAGLTRDHLSVDVLEAD
jgi:hypothetical protein